VDVTGVDGTERGAGVGVAGGMDTMGGVSGAEIGGGSGVPGKVAGIMVKIVPGAEGKEAVIEPGWAEGVGTKTMQEVGEEVRENEAGVLGKVLRVICVGVDGAAVETGVAGVGIIRGRGVEGTVALCTILRDGVGNKGAGREV
jgi:hypothetical protein